MPKKQVRAVVVPVSPPRDDDMDVDRELPTSGFKLIAELIAETDNNLPSEDIDLAIEGFSRFSDVSDWRGIPEFFPSLSSLSRRASTYDNWHNRFKVVDYLISCFNSLKESIIEYIEDGFEKNQPREHHQMNIDLITAVNMFVILAQRLTVQLQLYVSKTNATSGQTKKGSAKARYELDNDITKWKDIQRHRMINCLLELLELPVETATGPRVAAIQYVFSPDIMEKDFTQRFMDTVSHLLEDPENAARVNQPWITHYFRIWKVLAGDFQMGTHIANSMFKDTLELPYLETSNNFPFIEPLVQLMNESSGSNQPRIHKPLRHVLEMVVRRACCLYSGDRIDRPPPKAYCMIIQTLAVHCHDIMLNDVALVYKLMDNPNPNVRMSTLQGLADMFSSPYLSEAFCNNFEPRAKKRRAIFEKILAHTNDEGTNVRSKAVSLLRNLMENRRIPEEYESYGFVTVVGSRLQDKSVQVRKSAIQFLASFLDNNRHGHDFNRAVHVSLLDEKARELRLLDTPRSRVMQEAENTLARRQFQLRSEAKDQLLALFNGETELDMTVGTLEEVLRSINQDGAGSRIARYYARYEDFPVDLKNPKDVEVNGIKLVDRCVKYILEKLDNDYSHYKMQQLQMDDDQLLEDAQQSRDRSHETLQLRAQMQQMIDKMCIEVELSRCVEMTLRCVLMGESAEIKEGIKFLTRCKLFGITGADEAIRSMCCLVWRPAADVITELIEAAENMFISRLEGNEKAAERDKSTVENLMSAMQGVTERDRSSVEEVIYLLAAVEIEPGIEEKAKPHRKRKTIESNVIAKLWNIALDTSVGNEERKVVALRILYPISKTEKGLPEARTRLRSLQKKLVEGPVLAVEALRIISILGTPTKQEKEENAYSKSVFRINPEDSLFRSIEQLFFHEVVKADDDPNRDWFGIMRHSISSILNISMDVNVVLPRLASQFLFRVKKITEFYIFYSNLDKEEDAYKNAVAARRKEYWTLTWCRVMEKLMAFCGELAVQLHAFIQVNIPRLHKRYAKKILEAEKNDSKVREETVRFLTDLEKSIAQRKTIFEVPQDLTPGNSSNTLHHLVALMCDKRMFVPNRLLGRLLPIIVYSMRTVTMPLRIKQAALVAYGKFLPLSADISSFAAPSFFTAMMGSESTLVRCNLVAACCDFAFAQPTLFELYAPSLFRMSQDESPLARESTILVLSHLMSNDMIQTRGVLSEPARCISDPVRSVKEAAESFFRELNQRSDTIVQLLPEFLYRLSSKTERLPLKAYKIVFEFLIQLLKEKSKSSSDTMIDRVCLKFSNIDMNDSEAPKYLLIALSKFAQNDGGLVRLQDNWRHWSKFLCQPKVAEEFRLMIEHLQSSSKNEDFKNHCNELIASIDKIQEEGLRKEDITAAPAAAKKGGRGRRPAAAVAARDSEDAPGPSNRTPKKRRRRLPSEESEESVEEHSDFE